MEDSFSTNNINALFVETGGVYFDHPNTIPWDINRNAFDCENGLPAICHPPCKRWGRFWSGGPSAKVRRLKGDDKGAFAFCLWYVRTYGGVIEHPEASHAWPWFGLNKPPKTGGWIKADEYGGMTCCVEQGHYGHSARKATWLYINGTSQKELFWGKAQNKEWLGGDGYHSTKERLEKRKKECYLKNRRLQKHERLGTPIEFRDLLIDMVLNGR